MPTTSAAPAPNARPPLTTKNPTTTTTTSSFIETISASNVDGSTQTSIIPSATNSAIHKPILGDPTLDGAYKFIGIILIYSVVFLICFIIFAILTCRAIRTQTKTSPDPAIRLNHIRRKQRPNIFKSPEDDRHSVASTTPLYRITKPGASKQIKKHEIRCHSVNTVPGFTSDCDMTHDMIFQTNPSRTPSPSRRSSNDITTSSHRKGEGPPKDPNHSNKEIHYKTPDPAIKLLYDGEHGYSLNQPPHKLSSHGRDQDQNAGFQG
jgi:hypothetical protein